MATDNFVLYASLGMYVASTSTPGLSAINCLTASWMISPLLPESINQSVILLTSSSLAFSGVAAAGFEFSESFAALLAALFAGALLLHAVITSIKLTNSMKIDFFNVRPPITEHNLVTLTILSTACALLKVLSFGKLPIWLGIGVLYA